MFSSFSPNSRSVSIPTPIVRHYVNNTDAYTVGKPLNLEVADVLFCGEGNCSFTASWVDNHMSSGEADVAKRVLCTELMTYEDMISDHGTAQRIRKYTGLGTQFVYCLDATKSDEVFKGHTFCRMQFNCPHDRSNYYSIPPTLPPLVSGFFKAAQHLQESGGTVHMTLLQPPGKESLYQYFFQIVDGAEGTGVVFEDDLPFNSTRYPGYHHQMTHSYKHADNARYSREFVFVRGDNLNARTPFTRIDFDYPKLEYGPDAGESVQCDVYRRRSGNKTSYSALPPMREAASSQSPAKRLKRDLEELDCEPEEVVDIDYSLSDDEVFLESEASPQTTRREPTLPRKIKRLCSGDFLGR